MILQADGLSKSLQDRALISSVCSNCNFDCDNKKEMPKVSLLSQFVLHYYLNTDKKNGNFFYKGGFNSQPDWFINLYSEIEYNLKKRKEEK